MFRDIIGSNSMIFYRTRFVSALNFLVLSIFFKFAENTHKGFIMNVSDYEYRGLVARSWDSLRGDVSKFPDRHFFQEMILTHGEPVLIVGCGTGRLLLEYVGKGLDVEGLDISPEMLEICQQKADDLSLDVTLYQQPMERMSLPKQYQTILVPSSNFQLVPGFEAAKNALERFFHHLLPGGLLVMSIWQIKGASDAQWTDWWKVAEIDGFDKDKTLRRWERSMFDAATQLRHTENRYELVENGQVVAEEFHLRSPEMRNYSPGQLSGMLAEAGFSQVHSVSGFSSDPASEDDEIFCMLGEKLK